MAFLHIRDECEITILEQQKFSAPMPYIGLYVAAASLICSLAMAADVVRGFSHRKLWFPCKSFTLNVASLTLLAVAMKLPVDLSTPMSSSTDQLAKLSSTIFMCTVMSHVMPSLGPMGYKESLMNIAALSILVITIVGNVSIQLNTGVICVLRTEHVVVMVLMLLLLVILCFSTLTVPTFKRILELKYDEKHKMASNEESAQIEKFKVEKLTENVKKYWIMSESGGPQFVIASSVTSSASGAICFLSALTLAEAEIQQYLWRNTAHGFSDYKWSTSVILWIQSIGVAVGTIAPTIRWLTAISFKCSTKGSNSYQNVFAIENYWIQWLVEWKESPLGLRIRDRKRRKHVQDTKNQIMCIFIRVQIVIVIASKTVRLIPIIFISSFLTCCSCCKLLMRKLLPKPRASRNQMGSESEAGKDLDLSPYILQLEGEEELSKRILENISDSVNQFIQKAKRQQPKNLMELLQKSPGFKGLAEFGSNQVPRLHSDEPPNCWSMTVATLTSIAIALPNIKNEIADQLLCSVSEGFLYIRLIEKSLDTKGDLVNIRNAADVVWLGVELYRKWLDDDLHNMSLEGKSPVENLQRLGEIAKNSVMEFKTNMNGGPAKNPHNWPVKVIAANSMYTICNSILLDYEGRKDHNNEKMFEQLSVMIADILGACLANLPRVITMKCYCSSVEKREESVQEAARLLGETEEILKILQQHEPPSRDHDQEANIDDDNCGSLLKQKNTPSSISPSNNKTISGSGELRIDVE